jgi:pimeloyl-ACP methyl ester carboxylesterase
VSALATAIASPATGLRATSDDGATIAFSRCGAGPALVVVDGAFCFRGNGPAPALAKALGPQFTVFSYDRRGRGESTDTSPYAIAREVEDLQAVVRAAGGSAFALGVSSGAALALQAAAAGVPLRGLALYEPPFLNEGEQPRSYAGHRRRVMELLSAGDRAGAVRYFMSAIYGAPGWFVALMPILMRRAWKANESVAPTLPYDLTILDDRSVLNERSPAITMPTLVLGGAKSPASLREAVTAAAKALPDGRSRLLEGQTHNLQARAVAPVVASFFASL